MSGMASFRSGMAGPPGPPGEMRVTRLPSRCWLREPHGHSSLGSHSPVWKKSGPSVTSQRPRRMGPAALQHNCLPPVTVTPDNKPHPCLCWGLRGPVPARLASGPREIRETWGEKMGDAAHRFRISAHQRKQCSSFYLHLFLFCYYKIALWERRQLNLPLFPGLAS